MRVTVGQDKCISAGQCVLAAEQVFDQRDEDGVVVPLQPTPPIALVEAVRQAAAVCPVLAIELTE